MHTESKVAWAAGLFEGEGTVAHNGVNSIRASVTSTDYDVLQRLSDIARGGNFHKQLKRKQHWKQAWVWTINGQEAYDFLKLIRPYMLSRRAARIDEALDRFDQGVEIRNKKIATRQRILKLWETGEYTETQIGDITGTNRSYVNAVRMGKMKS